MILPDLSPLANHLWQSTACVAAVWLLTLALRQNRAGIRYWLWLAASVKFLIPFSLLVSAGAQLGWRQAPAIAPPQFSTVLDQIGRPFSISPSTVPPAASPASSPPPFLLFGVWLCGVTIVAVSWFRRWRSIRAAQRAGESIDLNLPIRAISTPAPMEPGVFGIFRPILLLPEGITDRLTPDQLQAVIAHELCHMRRRDNLTAAIHLVVETIFWFHPLLWWIRARLAEERERACDEEVLGSGSGPETYAEGILNVCKFFLESPPCMAGVTGADLKKRIESILARPPVFNLSLARKCLLVAAASVAIAGPVAIGLMNVPVSHAQSQAVIDVLPAFEVASVKPSPAGATERSLTHQPGPRLVTSNATVKMLVFLAYQVMPFQVSGGPAWLQSDGFDIEAKAADPKTTPHQFRQMIQRLLAERFHLRYHLETKEAPVYSLVVGKNGTKLVAAKDDDPEVSMRNGRGEMTGVRATMSMFAAALSRPLDRKVVDETGLTGAYTFKLQFVPDDNSVRTGEDVTAHFSEGPSLVNALQQQLGLNLKPGRAPVEVLVIDHADKPSAN
jgi:bla regulator protein blaR1